MRAAPTPSGAATDLDFKKINVRIFHLGYLLLLDALDEPDARFGTKAARLLARAQAAGVKTSADVVSEDSDRFARIVNPALRHVDYCILNEIEAGKTTGFKIRPPGGQLDTVALRHAAGALLQQGVRELVVVHFPEGAFARTRKGDDFWQPSLKLPPKYIAGTAGAGDAFCAGVLYGLARRLGPAAVPADGRLHRRGLAGGCHLHGGSQIAQHLARPGPQVRLRPRLDWSD